MKIFLSILGILCILAIIAFAIFVSFLLGAVACMALMAWKDVDKAAKLFGASLKQYDKDTSKLSEAEARAYIKEHGSAVLKELKCKLEEIKEGLNL